MERSDRRIKKIMDILSGFLCMTLVKRVLCAILIALEVDSEKIRDALGLSSKSIKNMKLCSIQKNISHLCTWVHIIEPVIEQAKLDKIKLFFVDASHFVMGGFSGSVWTKIRRYVQTACGRQRYNVLGALDNFI